MNSVINISQWRRQHHASFLPPVCNCLMHGSGQLDVMFVGGPNERRDYHVQQSEEFFYQLEGQLTLKIIENAKPKDVHIQAGEIFVLPAATPHSPQRGANSMGIVLERRRMPHEFDLLCFFEELNGDPTGRILFQTTGHWSELSTNMQTAFKKFYESENFKTGRTDVDYEYPFALNEGRVDDPVDLRRWIEDNRHVISSHGKILFPAKAFKIFVCGQGTIEEWAKESDTWLLQLEGSSVVKMHDKCFTMATNDSLLVPADNKYRIDQEDGSYVLACTQPNIPWKTEQATKQKKNQN